MNINKIIGYVLLIVGLLVIVAVAYQSYSIFIGKAAAPLIFMTSPVLQNSSAGTGIDIQSQINETVRKQISQMIGPDTITKTLNLLAWSFLAGILITAGGVIAGIGVKLVK